MTNEYRVRWASLEDLEGLQRLDVWPSPEVWAAKITQREVWVLEDTRGHIWGLMRFAVLWTTVPFLGLIVIDESKRGLGLSRIMLDGLCSALKERGFVALLSSSQTNEPKPQAWHSHMGFRSNGIIEHIEDLNVGEIVYRLVF